MPAVPRFAPADVEVLLRIGADTGDWALPAPTQTPVAADVLTVVDLDGPAADDPARVAAAAADSARLLVGVTTRPFTPGAAAIARELDVTISAVPQDGPHHVEAADPDGEIARIAAAVTAAPRAALALAGLLRLTAGAGVRDGLVAESFAYSALLAGPEFAAWRAARPARPVPPVPADAVLAVREGDTLRLTLNRPDRRNAFGHGLRDALIAGLELAHADPALRVELRGAGPSFSAGGDLDEFGTAADPASAHVVRLARSAGWWVHGCRDRVTAYVHGACVGAGVEVPSFAAHVVARPDAWFMLPELGLGLVPGAGGTVSMTHRIGRWRTAWMTLTGDRVPAATALSWGLVDEVAEHDRADEVAEHD